MARKKERKKDERRKLLAGTVALAELAAHPDSPFAVTLLDLLNNGLTKAPDRSLFNLQPLPKESKPQAALDGLADGEKLPPDEPAAVAPVPKSPEPTETEAEDFARLLGRLNALCRPESEAPPDEPAGRKEAGIQRAEGTLSRSG